MKNSEMRNTPSRCHAKPRPEGSAAHKPNSPGLQAEEFSRLQRFILAEMEKNGGTLSLREALGFWPGEVRLGYRVSVYRAFRRLCERGFIEPFIQSEAGPIPVVQILA